MNINTEEFWNNIHQVEQNDSWREYPITFNTISKIVGEKKVVAELGCGMGILAKKLIDNHNKYIGLDISSIPKTAIEGMGGQFVQANFAKVFIETKRFADFVIATEFLEHFEDADYIVKHSKELIKENGTAIFSVPNNCLGHDELEEHYQMFNVESIKELFLKHYKFIEVYNFVEMFDTRLVDSETMEKVVLPTLLVVASDIDRRQQVHLSKSDNGGEKNGSKKESD